MYNYNSHFSETLLLSPKFAFDLHGMLRFLFVFLIFAEVFEKVRLNQSPSPGFVDKPEAVITDC